MDINQWKQHIGNPYRITNETETLLDLILTRLDDTKTSDSGAIHLGISDRSLAYICRKIKVPKEDPKSIEMGQFKKFNSFEFQNDLREVFGNFGQYTDVNLAWHSWKEIFAQIADCHAPVQSRKVKNEYRPWLTSEIKTMNFRKDYLKKKKGC